MSHSIPASDADWKTQIDTAIKNIEVKGAVSTGAEVPINKAIDHTLLKLDATPEQVNTLCNEAREYDFATVCVRPNFAAQCVKNLQGTDVRVASVIGFHEGTYSTTDKLRETETSLEAGASELDLVINWPQLKQQQYSAIFNELESIRKAAPRPALIKLILETAQLNADEIVAACVLASAADLDYVKTSTGFLGHGAKVEQVRLMAACCEYLQSIGGRKMLVKASGGVRSLQDAVTMLQAGASRLGTSAGVAIAQQKQNMVAKGKALHGSSEY